MKQDVIYEYLVNLADDTGFIDKKQISYVDIGKELNITRQTVSTQLNNLVTKNKIKKNKDGYIIIGYKNNISVDNLKIVNCVLGERAKQIFKYLREQGRTKFTTGELARIFNEDSNTILVILIGLQRLGLMKIHGKKYLDEQAERIVVEYYIDAI